jgi:hypothetical protein
MRKPMSGRAGGPSIPRHEPTVLARGKQFHREVQAAYVAGLLGVKSDDAVEQTIVRPGGGRGRADILLLVSGQPERMRFVVEIKSTEWEGRTEANRRRLFLRHVRQMNGYLDVLLEDIGDDVDTVIAAMLYPHRPSEPAAQQLEAIALPLGIMVVYYDDMDWNPALP